MADGRLADGGDTLEDGLGVLARQLDAPDVNGLVGEAAFFLGFDVDHLATLIVTSEVDSLGTLSPRHDRGWWLWWCVW
jgi:hypothetical protein